MKPDLILLYSGGADSTLLLEMALKIGYTPLCITFDYGQVHKQELESASAYCHKKEIPQIIMKVPLDGVSSALTDGNAQYEGVSEWHVPSRNLIFISLATSIAESKGIKRIWYGANYGDRENLFPDCYQEWVYKLNQLLAINGSMIVEVEAPLLGLKKDSILQLMKTYYIDKSEIFSGYGQD